MTVIRIYVNPYAKWHLPLIDLQWYQHLHDKNYHHDVYVMQNMKRIQHLVNHISKYHRRNFNETDTNPEKHLYKDTIACIFSIAGTLGFDLTKVANEKGMDIKTISDIKPIFDDYAVYNHMNDALDNLTKALEGWDHIEDIDYRTVIKDNTLTLLLCTFQLYVCGVSGRKKTDIPYPESVMSLLELWVNQLEVVKTKHCFHDYFHDELISNETYRNVRSCLLKS